MFWFESYKAMSGFAFLVWMSGSDSGVWHKGLEELILRGLTAGVPTD